ncbi:DNA mismatch repair endonuclease MutL [Treponema primitia]|uniref:DNA mismatch repair endonuclease MutL n=1 Tax=Treponema primitia TaxID=88058 RepID=UPI0002554C8E|nr:DNA mismatch repair endonuclease MutL [Treponema primitia]
MADNFGSQNTHIHLLPPEEARKIAAGEVVDRPAALVREFLDNAIDAGGTTIELLIDGGGIRRTEVLDNGNGMEREDLVLCWQTHATSKIRSLEDLNTAETLGFRGEALAAAAAVSRLEILTSTDGREAWRLTVGPAGSGFSSGGGLQSEEYRIEQFRRAKGTSVRALGLFDTIPARKRFLKREGSEAALCRQIFIEKALAFYSLNFRFTQDGNLKLYLQAVSSLKERFANALLEKQEGVFLHEINAQGEGFKVTIVVGGPELFHSDRRHQYIFANGRRIHDYSMLQALEYGTQGWFPNGTHPIGAVYIDIDPSLVDFNIHPAKREVRFKDPGTIHHGISSALRNFLHHNDLATRDQEEDQPRQFALPYGSATPPAAAGFSGRSAPSNAAYAANAGYTANTASMALEALLEKPPVFTPLPGRGLGDTALYAAPADGDSDGMAGSVTSLYAAEPRPAYGGSGGVVKLRLAGRIFKLFILAELGDRLFIIDQHAAHERILYDRFLSKPIPIQELLVPMPFSTESEEDDMFLASKQEELKKLGIIINSDADGSWIIEALPAGWQLGDGETLDEILKLKTAGKNMAEHWAATLSCHGAIKDGDYLDDTAALELAEAALALKIPRCPHGRPLWVEVSREDLFRGVQRV